MTQSCDKKNPDCIEWMAIAGEQLRRIIQTQDEFKDTLSSITTHIIGNGTPGLNERVRKLEWWHKVRVKVYSITISAVVTIGTGVVIYYLTK